MLLFFYCRKSPEKSAVSSSRPSPQNKPKKNEPARHLASRLSPYSKPVSNLTLKEQRKNKLRDLSESSKRLDNRDRPRAIPGKSYTILAY